MVNIAAGVAKDNAHGQVTINTATAVINARLGSTCQKYNAVPAAANKTNNKNGWAIRSAKIAKRGFSTEARSIKATICA